MFFFRNPYMVIPPIELMSDDTVTSKATIITDPEVFSAYQSLLEKTGYLAVFSVVSAIKTAHLSRIARIMGKSKSTVLTSIDSMLNEDHPVIEVDVDTTINTRGVKKYYRLTELGSSVNKFFQQYFNDSGTVTDEQIEQVRSFSRDDYINSIKTEMVNNVKNFGVENMINFFTLNSELNVFFRRTAAQGYVDLAQSFAKGDDVKLHEIPHGVLFTSLKRLHISNFEQSLKVRQLLSRFVEDIEQLEKEFIKENEKNLETGKISSDDIHDQILSVDITPIIDYEK